MAKKRKTPTKTELEAKTVEIVDVRMGAFARIERELERLYKSYFARVKALVATNKSLSRTDALNLQATTKMMGDLQEILEEAGLPEVIRDYAREFPKVARAAASYYEEFGLDPSQASLSRETLVAAADFAQSELAGSISQKLVPPLQSALLQANFGGLSREAVIDQVTALEPSLTPTQAKVLVDDAFAQLQRTAIVEKADELGLDIYIYLGPDDAITSPQCQEMLRVNRHGVPGMLYKDEITVDLDPNLRRSPLIGGGHPRCRHHWSPIPPETAEEMGFKPREQEAA